MVESAVIDGQSLADFHNLGTAEAVGIVSRLDRALEQHPVAVAGFRRVLVVVKDLVVWVAVGTDRRVAAEGRC